MLRRESRLRVGEYRTLRGRIVRGEGVLLKIFSPKAQASRFGVVAGKPAARHAVERNALRRAAFAVCATIVKKLPPHDYLIIFSSPPRSLKERRDSLIATFHKAFPGI